MSLLVAQRHGLGSQIKYPRSIAGAAPYLWLRANIGSDLIADGSGNTDFRDASGNNRRWYFNKDIGNDVNEQAQINGYDCIRHELNIGILPVDNDQYNYLTDGSTAWSMYFLIRPTDGTGVAFTNSYIDVKNGNWPQGILGYINSAGTKFQLFFNPTSGPFVEVTITPNAWNLISMFYAGGIDTGIAMTAGDDSQIDTDNVTTNAGGGFPLCIGTSLVAGGGYDGGGLFAMREFILFLENQYGTQTAADIRQKYFQRMYGPDIVGF